MKRTSRRSSEDHSSVKKRTRRHSSSESSRKPSIDKSNTYLLSHVSIGHRKRDEKKSKRERSASPVHKSSAKEKEAPPHVMTRRMSQAQDMTKDEIAEEGAYENFPQITSKTVELLKKRGINYLFPVQSMTFRTIWNRKDVIVRDLTGSGKTLGFSLPMVEYFRKNKSFGRGKIQGIVLAPTRELALQCSKELNALKHYETEYNVLTVYGGVSLEDQTYQLRKGVDIFVGTTGRVLDHMERKNFNFSELQTVVLDEADQMLKLGFKEDVDKIIHAVKEKAPKDL